MTFLRGFSTPNSHPELREGSPNLGPQPRSPRLHLVPIAMRLLDPSFHGLFALLTTRFAQDDFSVPKPLLKPTPLPPPPKNNRL